MTALITALVAALLYPGLAWSGLVLALVALLRGATPRELGATLRAAPRSTTPLAWRAALLSGGAALALLAWPAAPPHLWLSWTLLETCQLLALMPALVSSTPLVSQAAVREAQLTAAGRVGLWLGVGVNVTAGAPPVARIVGMIAALLALPLALNWPPFGSPPAAALLATPAQRPVVALLESLRWATALALFATATVQLGGLPWWAVALAQLTAMLGLAAVGRGLHGSVVLQRLDTGLRWFWRVVVPLGALALGLLWRGI